MAAHDHTMAEHSAPPDGIPLRNPDGTDTTIARNEPSGTKVPYDLSHPASAANVVASP